MTRKSLIIITIVVVAMGTAFLAWRVQDTRARAEKLESEILKQLTAEEIGLIIKSEAIKSEADTNSQAAVGITENPEARRAFLKKMRDILALAAEARREGMAEDPRFKINVAYKKNLLLQNLYTSRMSKDQVKALIVPEEIQAVWSMSENEARFSQDQVTLKAIQKVYAESRETEHLNSKLEGEKLEKVRKAWAITKVFSDKAKADAEFMQKPEVKLRLRIVEAGILAFDYLNKHWRKDIKANDLEIKAYLAAHPEYDVSKKREKSEMVLRRARAGEDFSKLAAEFSEDRSTKSKGGLYENVSKDYLWPEVETAVLALEEGQIADKLIETHTGFHVVRLESKQVKKEKDGSETVKFSVRHILLQKSFAEPNSYRPDMPAPFMKAEEIAKAEVEKEKYNALVTELIQRNQIAVPDDFA